MLSVSFFFKRSYLSLIEKFDLKVESCLSSLYRSTLGSGNLNADFSRLKIGAGISGGADSMAMLTSLIHFSEKTGASLFVVTVNHRIRSEEESAGDAQFVADFCKDKGVNCIIHSFEKGLVDKTEQERNCGIEEAARFLRYKVFDDLIEKQNLDVFCLAHNQNDNLETIIMRFLQGASSASSGGIRKQRGKYARPLLEISRDEIETYLTSQNIPWRTDSTNFDNTYLRNRIRHKILPAFNSFFPGWKTAILAASEKNRLENDYLNSVADTFEWKRESETCFSMNVSELVKIHPALRNRLIYKAANEIGVNLRIPFSFVQSCNKLIDSWNLQKKNSHSVMQFCSFADLQGRLQDNVFFVEKKINLATHKGFFAIIEEEGEYSFPSFTLNVKAGCMEFIAGGICEGSVQNNLSLPFADFPFCVRSRQVGDEIETSDGKMKSVNDIFSDWGVPEDTRDLIPLVQKFGEANAPVQCICGSVFGFKNWIVKQHQ